MLLDTLALELDFDLDLPDYLIESLQFGSDNLIRISTWNGVGYDSYILPDVYTNANYIHLVPMSSSSEALGTFVCGSKSTM